jgi:hypothetical protein
VSDYVYAPKMDSNHQEIVKAFEDMYCEVIDTHKLGFGFPDILIAFANFCVPCEIKTEEGELSASQRTFVRDWKGPRIPIIRSREDAIAYVTAIRLGFIRKWKQP